MSKFSKVKNFIETKVHSWILQNISPQWISSFPADKDFPLVPVSKSDPNFAAVVAELGEKLVNTTVGKFRKFDDLCVMVLREGEKVIVVGVYQTSARSLTYFKSEKDDAMTRRELSFLQKIIVLKNFDIPAIGEIDAKVWIKGPIFEKDIEQYMPKILAYELPADQSKESDDFAILKFLCSLDLGARNVYEFQPEIFSVLHSLPANDHDWLTQQFLSSLLSGRDSNYFAELYKLVEFFFPLQNVEKLKASTGFNGSLLQLLSYCRRELNWNQNHNTGARACITFASSNFAVIMLQKKAEDEERSEVRFKEDAMEKISNLRHSIIHQDFSQSVLEPSVLKLATNSILVFLSESFGAYSQSIKSTVPVKI